MKTLVRDLVLPETLRECHEAIRKLTLDLNTSQTRVVDLEGKNRALTEKVRDLMHRLFGRKSERQTFSDPAEEPEATPNISTSADPSATPAMEDESASAPSVPSNASEPGAAPSSSPRRRGQQSGAPGHGRRRHLQLPERTVYHDVPIEGQQCSLCGAWYSEAGVEEAEQIDWQVRVERVVIRRQRYRKTCDCRPEEPRSLVAPPPPTLIPKGVLTVPAVVTLVLMKFLWGMPLHRIVRLLAYQGCAISPGTLVGVLKRLAPLLEPLDQAIRAHNRDEPQLHADESRWQVWSDTTATRGNRWWLWVFGGRETTVFLLDPSRSARVPRRYLQLSEEAGPTSSYGRQKTLITDNYIVYRILGAGIRNAWCWAHIRRKFVEAARSVPALDPWSGRWVERIAELYRRHSRRADAPADTAEWQAAHEALRTWVIELERTWRKELADPNVDPRGAKVLHTVERQWEGLIVFLDDPRIPLDNNAAERWLRTPVVGRKNYYGSRSQWSGELAARCWTLWATAAQNDLNPQAYLTAYLQACAEQGGTPLVSDAIQRFLPWALSASDRAAWAAPGTWAS